MEYNGIIDHQLLTPGFVATNLSEEAPGFLVPTAEEFVKSAILTIGITDTACGYFSHEWSMAIYHCLPGWLTKIIMNVLMEYLITKKNKQYKRK